MKKWLIGFLAVVVVLAGVGYKYRLELVRGGINLLVKLRMPVGPHKEIHWSKSTAETWKGDRPPNIVLIVADDLGWNDLTLNGGGVAGGTVPTPYIDSLVAEGVQFTNGYSACGTCAPSRAALMSGRYPTRFGFEFTPTPPGMLRTIARMARGRTEGPQLITHFEERRSGAALRRDGHADRGDHTGGNAQGSRISDGAHRKMASWPFQGYGTDRSGLSRESADGKWTVSTRK